MEKVKILIIGPVNGALKDFTQKLNTLQKSKAGPFDMCFCAGPFFSSNDNCIDATKSLLNGDKDKDSGMPLPVYFCDVGALPPGCELNLYGNGNAADVRKDEAEIEIPMEDEVAPTLKIKEEIMDSTAEAEEKNDAETNQNQLPKGVITIAHNLHLLHGISSDQTQTADVLNIPISLSSTSSAAPYITVAFVPPNARVGSAQTIKLESKTNHAAFVGVDVLLTSDWGQGMASSNCISQEDRVKLGLDSTSTTVNIKEIGSYDIAELASQCRPRYHIAPALIQSIPDPEDPTSIKEHSIFFQSIPYANPPSARSSGVLQNYHTTRFLALCPVVDAATQKKNGKAKKYIHALGIQPLWNMDRVMATAVPENVVVVPSPYTDECYQKSASGPGPGPGARGNANANGSGNGGPYSNVNVGLSEAQTRRIISENSNQGQDHRWNIRNRKRPLELDATNCSLFLHGLHNDPSGGMTLNRDSIQNAFQDRGCWGVRMPHTDGHPSYCFLDFGSHEEAKLCLEQSGGEEQVLGVPLTMKWSSGGRRNGNGGPPPPPPPGHVGIYGLAKRSKTRLTEAEAADSSSLFVHLNVRVDDKSHDLCSRGIQYVGKLAEKVLEDAINADGGEERVTADDEPALKVTARPLIGKHCGFLDFASHAAASMSLATMTGSTDGGEMQQNLSMNMGDEDKDEEGLKESLRQVQLWWARAKDTSNGKDNGDSHGFQFRSQHFPHDARTDCWFCLASPTCEKHLIVSVSDNCYVAMPKGPVNKHHALIVPVNHSASEGTRKTPILGAFLDPTPGAVADLEEAKEKLRKYAREELDKDLFVFERAIPTRGGYHAHINCIPVDRGLGSKIRTTMLSLAAGAGFTGTGNKELRELQNPDISITTILKNTDEDELVGYFYAEVPFGDNGDIKRFLYTALEQEGRVDRKQIPLQFGREILASVLGDENLSHWKGCVLSNEVEAEYTDSFRKSFAKYE